MDFTIETRDLIAMLVSVTCGSIIGFEREYRNKSAGFRTIILICLGSTIFTIVSWHGDGTDDRISANIITGIGFIGAGVIFQDRISVRGLTTAAVIWTAAAIGMTAGIGYYALALLLTLSTLFVLVLVGYVEQLISRLKKQKMISVMLIDSEISNLLLVEERLRRTGTPAVRLEVAKDNGRLSAVYLVNARKEQINKINMALAEMKEVVSFA